jgi:hypothetical protein
MCTNAHCIKPTQNYYMHNSRQIAQLAAPEFDAQRHTPLHELLLVINPEPPRVTPHYL